MDRQEEYKTNMDEDDDDFVISHAPTQQANMLDSDEDDVFEKRFAEAADIAQRSGAKRRKETTTEMRKEEEFVKYQFK